MIEQQHTPVTLEETAVQELASHLRGTLLRPGDAGYEQARAVYNGMINKHPALIARCVDVADVIAAVNFAREHRLTLAVRGGAQLPTMHSTMHLYPINGAVHCLGASDTAFSFREANFAEVIVGVDPDPANNERMIQWARDYWMALHPYSAGGGYINMMMDEGTDTVQAAYRDNYAWLAQIKATYDPGNLFHVNQNIKPGS